MSDLKLYKGINNIDADLIEEANCNHKPAIHHCYALPATAAAIFIALGATGIFNTVSPQRKQVVPEDIVVTEEITTAVTTASPVISSDISHSNKAATTSLNAQSPAASTQTSVSYSKTSIISQNSQTETAQPPQEQTVQNTQVQTAAMPALTVTNLTSAGRETGTAAVSTVTTAVPEYNDEYEGSIIMRKYAAALAALMAISGTTSPAPVHAETVLEESPTASCTKKFLDECNVDLDLNSDGKVDIFDIYAMYRCEYGPDGTVPDYIKNKYDSITKKRENEKEEVVTIQGIDFYELPFWLDFRHFAAYYFTYCSMEPEYFDARYYVENCPDEYYDPLPLDVVKEHIMDITPWDGNEMFRTCMYVKNDDGTYRLFTADDLEDAYYYDEDGVYRENMDFFCNKTFSCEFYSFIGDLKSYVIPFINLKQEYADELINKGVADPDINSDGVYDFDDIVLLQYYVDTYLTSEDAQKLYYAYKHPKPSYFENYPAELRESPDNPITESEWNNARDFLSAMGLYYDSDNSVIRDMAKNYLLKNEVDSKYFDPVYYEKNHFAHYRYEACFMGADTDNNGSLFNILGVFEDYSYRYGPGAEKYKSLIEEYEKRNNYTENDVQEAFVTYYKNVKAGITPEPDMNLDGKIDFLDYCLLDDIDWAYMGIENDIFNSLARRYPEVVADINISQEAIYNYKNNFDFNNNGISCDYVETKCMRMYILDLLEPQYENKDALCTAIWEFEKEHPELKYMRTTDELMEAFIKAHDVGFTKKPEQKYEEYDEENTEDITNTDATTTASDSHNKVYSSPTAAKGSNGDANVDGTVDLSDTVLIMQALANPSKYGINGSDDGHITEEGWILADVDGNGVTNGDALTIQRSLLGLCSIN